MTPPPLVDSPSAPEQPRARLGGALSLSAGAHVAAAIVLAVFVTGRGVVPLEPVPVSDLSPSIVWVPSAAPPGGPPAGGRGDSSSQPARAAQLAGPGRIAVPVQPPPTIQPSTKPADGDPTLLVAPLQPTTAGLDSIVGLLQSVSIDAPPSRGPGSGDGVGSGGGKDGVGSGDRRGIGDSDGGGGLVLPRSLVQVKPDYTDAALHAKLQGVVGLEAVVLADGSVGEVKIVRSLDPIFGLDQSAIRAVRAWKFVPAMRNGRPVPIIVSIELSFVLR
jgi:protein TonB